MTHDKWAKLTDEEKRIKVAELCGWERDTGNPPYTFGPRWYLNGNRYDDSSYAVTPNYLPDYLNDLNTMHEVETVMLLDPRCLEVHYLCRLGEVCGKPRASQERELYHATAAQRAEAFVLTMEPEGG